MDEQKRLDLAEKGRRALAKNREKMEATSEQTKTRRELNRDYYKENREEIRAKRALRYKTDKQYRETVQARARAARRKLTEQQEAVRKITRTTVMEDTAGLDFNGKCPTCGRAVRTPHPPKLLVVPRQVKGGGTRHYHVMMYPLGTIALKLGRKPATIDLWTRLKYIPEPGFKNKSNRRMWSQDQVELLIRVVARFDLRPPINFVRCGFVKTMFNEWRKLAAKGGFDQALYTEFVELKAGEQRVKVFRRPDAGVLPKTLMTNKKNFYVESTDERTEKGSSQSTPQKPPEKAGG